MHKDYSSLQQASSQIEQVASYLDGKSKEAERIAKVLDIQSRLHGAFEVSLLPPS
jgi:hypothetical protein